ncbi:MAG: AAA family ATPase [Deltaproteobacteria bacterium]|nr:AAA family ATPase [Deltaproteobacteria bacterium]
MAAHPAHNSPASRPGPPVPLPQGQVCAELLQRELLLVTGKGGVGKSTLAQALARHASQQGKRVLLVELESVSRAGPLFGVRHVGPHPQRVAANLDVMALDVMDSLRFFAVQQLKVETLVNLALRNKAVESFFQAVPAIKPILVLYQVWHMLQLHGPRGDRTWDLAICDLPTSGFVQGMYQIPRTLQQAFRSGPVHTYATGMRELLLDPNRAGLVLVTLPEDMPVVETLELQAILHKAHGVLPAALVLNGVAPSVDAGPLDAQTGHGGPTGLQGALWAARWLQERRQRALALLPRLNDAAQGRVVQVPFLFRRDLPLPQIDEIARLLAQDAVPA